MNRIHRFTCVLSFFIFASASIFGQNTIQSAVDLFSVDPNFANASLSFMAMDCSTGQIIASKNPDLSLPPASTTKLWSTATAYQLLGKDYAPKTRIYIDGTITDSVLNGNLWIRGGGDIALGSRYYNADGIEDTFLRLWSDTLKVKGIKKITGAIIADASEFGYEGAPDGWAWGDMGNYYGAAGSGLPIYDNMLRYYFATGKTSGSSTAFLRTFPVVPGLSYHNYISTGGSGDNSYIYGAPYSLDRFGTGTLQAGSNKFMVKGSLPDPELTFAQEFSRVLKEKGFIVSDSCAGVRSLKSMAAYNRYTPMTLLYTHVGKTLNSVAWWTNMKSVNTFAEEILCWVGYGSNGNGSIENSLDKEMDYWKTRINTSGLYLKDGSGLSRSNAISAQHFCNMLKYMTTSTEFEAFYGTLAVAGVSGTLSDVCQNQAGEKRVHAKSGTMKRIKSYAGYVETKSGKKLCFAIIVNNYNCSNEITLERIEKVMNAMALY